MGQLLKPPGKSRDLKFYWRNGITWSQLDFGQTWVNRLKNSCQLWVDRETSINLQRVKPSNLLFTSKNYKYTFYGATSEDNRSTVRQASKISKCTQDATRNIIYIFKPPHAPVKSQQRAIHRNKLPVEKMQFSKSYSLLMNQTNI